MNLRLRRKEKCMKYFICLVFVFRGAIMAGAAEPSIAIPSSDQIVARVRVGHPRLLANSNDFVQLRQRVASDGQLKTWLTEIRMRGEKLLGEEPAKYEIPDGLRLLATSRRVLYRTQTLGLLHRLDGDVKWRDRLWKELDAAASFPDWNPKHFLDTAEMTHAFAIAYDWLYDGWTPQQRAVLRTAMVEKGIKLANKIHREKRSWATARHNWNQVCNGGIGMGALALADEEPKLAGEFLESGLKSIQLAMAEFAPDGAWAEGPGYWDYATTYNVVFLAGLQSALGTDFGLSKMEGFSEAGMFPLYLTGPLNRTFNYADGGDGAVRAAQLFWMAKEFKRPAYARYERRLASPEPLDLVWYDSTLANDPSGEALPLEKYFRGAEVVTMRSAWNDPNALFVGFKAGDNKANHSHLDLGSFVFDALGKRWAIDMGADDYNLPAYFGNKRWTYYRSRAEGQNALVINPGAGPDQDAKAASKIVRFEKRGETPLAIADLTAAYGKHAQRVERGIALLNRERLLIKDEVKSEHGADVWWFMHTPAEIEISSDGRIATLKQGEARLQAAILSPSEARFESRAAEPLPSSPHPEKQNLNRGIRKLTIHIGDARELRLDVLLTPIRDGKEPSTAPAFEW
jgi:hypothetical protein